MDRNGCHSIPNESLCHWVWLPHCPRYTRIASPSWWSKFSTPELSRHIYIDTLNLQSGVQKIEFLGVGRFSTEKHSLYCLALKHDTHWTYPYISNISQDLGSLWVIFPAILTIQSWDGRNLPSETWDGMVFLLARWGSLDKKAYL